MEKNIIQLSTNISPASPAKLFFHGAGIIDLFNKQAADAVFAKEYSPHIFQFSMPQITIPAISLVGEGYKTGIISFAAQSVSSIGSFFSNIFGG